MSVTPRGMSVQEAYRIYRDGNFLVNRRYQRKLVWTLEEKQKLIDSMMRDYPIPLLLLAERPSVHGSGRYEVIDGMQRLNAIFTFIENYFSLTIGCFDIQEFARAKQAAESDIFKPAPPEVVRLSPQICADLLDYQLAVTIFPAQEENEITEVFGRINSGGKQLSAQEKRQAGVVSPFAEMVRKIASELRGDASKEVLLLTEMPEISIDSKTSHHGYGLRAEDTFWVKQGVLRVAQLRDSEDEQMIADIAVSVLLSQPLAMSRDQMDDIYTTGSDEFNQVENALVAYGSERLTHEIKTTFSVLKETIERYSNDPNTLRKVINPTAGSNPIKTPFYAVFMSFFALVIQSEETPDDATGIMEALRKLAKHMAKSARYATTKDRVRNINLTKGLISKYFVHKEPPALRHGPGLALDFENSIRRSRIEVPRYEFKQGLLRLSATRQLDHNLLEKVVIETICGIANLGPDADGYLYIGVADSKEDAIRISDIDHVTPIEINGRFVVGIDREATQLGIGLEQYVGRIVSAIRQSALTETLKLAVLGAIDTIDYRGHSVVRIKIPAQGDVTFVGITAFSREGSSTVTVTGPQVLDVHKRFQRSR